MLYIMSLAIHIWLDVDKSLKPFVLTPLLVAFSVLVHSGGVHGGHYYAYIRPTLSDQWYVVCFGFFCSMYICLYSCFLFTRLNMGKLTLNLHMLPAKPWVPIEAFIAAACFCSLI